MVLKVLIVTSCIVLFAASVLEQPAAPLFASASTDKKNGSAADAAAIRAHIESIFQAFLDGDIEKIHATHSEDWRGFLEGAPGPIKGIDE